MATDYGTDVSCVSDFSAESREVSGPANVAEALARRLTTPRGWLIRNLDYGTDLREYLGIEYTSRVQSKIISETKAECLKDERVLAVSVSVDSFDTSGRTLSLRISVTLADGPFTFVLTVSALDANITLLAA